MRKRITALLLAALLCLTMLPGAALAEEGNAPALPEGCGQLWTPGQNGYTTELSQPAGNNRPLTAKLVIDRSGIFTDDSYNYTCSGSLGEVFWHNDGFLVWDTAGATPGEGWIFAEKAGNRYAIHVTVTVGTPATGVYMSAANGAPDGNVTAAVPKDDGNGHSIPTFELNYSSAEGLTFYYYNANAVSLAADSNDAGKVSIGDAGSNLWKVDLAEGVSGNTGIVFFVTDGNGVANIFVAALTDTTPPPMGPQVIPAETPYSIPYEVQAGDKYAGASGDDKHLAAFAVEGETYYMNAGDPFVTFPDGHSEMSQTMEPEADMDVAYSVGFYVKLPGENNYGRVADSDILDKIETAFGGTLQLEVLPYEKTDTDIFAPKMFPALHSATISNYMYDNNYCTSVMRLGVENRGWYIVRATGTVDGKEIAAESSFFWDVRNAAEQKTLDYSEWSGEMLNAVIPGLNYELESLAEQYTSVDVYLPAAELAGYIEVPASLGDVTVSIHGVGDGMEINTVATKLRGGIISNNELTYVENVWFIGAGMAYDTWGEGPNADKANQALSGSGTTNADLCIFEGFKIAANTTGEGNKSVFRSVLRNNGTAVCIDSASLEGGNHAFSNNRFERNDVAIHFKNLSRDFALTWFDISGDSFIDNGIDILNSIGRNIFIPGNFFGMTDENGYIVPRECIYSPVANGNARKQVLYYPQAEDMRCISYKYDTSFYNHTGSQTGKHNPVISVNFAATFPIPAEVLAGSTFEIMNQDSLLAKITFLPAQMRMMRLMSLEESETFDATVSVERSEDGKRITITTQSFPSDKMATISVPCDDSWNQAKVMAGNDEFEATVEDGFVSFTVEQGGAYVIERVDPPAPSAPPVRYYTLSFAVNGGSALPSLRVEEYDTVDLTRYVPTRSGHSFLGWFADAALTQPMGEVRMDSNVTAYAAWELNFTDVDTEAYYGDAVAWAVDAGITVGTDDTSFSPEKTCTRAEMVTFLWRAAGCPMPEGSEHSFADVDEEAYYYAALLWAVENGIANGVSTDAFAPGAECTRAQMAAFLYRCAGSLAVSGENAFGDVDAADYYYNAVLWAAQAGITNGTGEGAFSPDELCTRAQIVTFLYRYYMQ